MSPSRQAWQSVRGPVLKTLWTMVWCVLLPIGAWMLPRWVFPSAVTLFFGVVMLISVLSLIHDLTEWRRIRKLLLEKLVDEVHDL